MSQIAKLRQDFVYGARLIAKSPGYASVAVLSLAFGIGANTAIFSLIDAVLLKNLPVKDPAQLVALTNPTASYLHIGISKPGERDIVSTREFEALRDRTQSFSGVLASQCSLDPINARIDGKDPEEVRPRLVSGNYFTVLGVTTARGRAFTASDDRGPGSAPYTVISYEFWQRRFGGALSTLHSRIRIGKADLAIIGVAPPHFLGENVGDAPDLWIPLDMQPLIMPGSQWLEDDPALIAERVMWLHVIGRLKPGISRSQAQANVDVVFTQVLAEQFSRLSQTQPDILKQKLVVHDAGAGISHLRGNFADPLQVLMAVAVLVLAIACVNVANLCLARAAARQKEMSVRLALGAGRARIVQQVLTESLMLSIAGGLLGSLLAVYGVRLLVAMVSDGPGSVILDARPDPRILAFTMGISLLAGIVFGLAPAWRSAGVSVSRALNEAGRGMTRSRAKISAANILVVGQIALSVMLLIGAGWFIRTLRNLENVGLGYPREKLVLVGVDFLSGGYSGKRLPIAYNEVRDRLARIPGVRGATYSSNGLFSGTEAGDKISVEGYKSQNPQDLHARFDQAGPHYFSTVGIPILLGRDIGPQDVESAASVCVVNHAFAKFYFGLQNPIGRHVTDKLPDARKTHVIVGVANDARDHDLRKEIPPRFYLSAQQPLVDYWPYMNYEIRTSGEPAGMAEAARRAILAYDPGLPVEAKPLAAMLDDHLRQERIVAQLSTAFGGVALLLAAIGLYGVLSFAVAQRTNEIGIRMALGAERGTVVRMVLRETALLIAIGLAAGVSASLACARLIESKFFGLKPADPATLAGALAIMIVVALLSGYLPARRASRVDPLIALRYE
jgi:predicted permease